MKFSAYSWKRSLSSYTKSDDTKRRVERDYRSVSRFDDSAADTPRRVCFWRSQAEEQSDFNFKKSKSISQSFKTEDEVEETFKKYYNKYSRGHSASSTSDVDEKPPVIGNFIFVSQSKSSSVMTPFSYQSS